MGNCLPYVCRGQIWLQSTFQIVLQQKEVYRTSE